MKKTLVTDADLRARWSFQPEDPIRLEAGAVLTPSARDFIRENRIELAELPPAETARGVMTRCPVPTRGGKPVYVDLASGRSRTEKPEGLTHLRGNLLVEKTSPRIAFRGKLDALMARLLLVELAAEEAGQGGALADLEEVHDRVQAVLAAEVKEKPLPALELFGLDEAELRRQSHQVKEALGLDHPIPRRSMGRLCLELNLLRTQVREAELCAAGAFDGGREDILRWLNRLSSGVYLIFCRELAGYYDREEGGERTEDL